MIRTVNDARNPRWANAAKTEIVLEVDFNELDYDYVEFTAVENDGYDHTSLIWNNCLAGVYGAIADYVPPSDYNSEDSLQALGEWADIQLRETDHIEMPIRWNSMTTEKQNEWTAYRTALINLVSNSPNALLVWSEDDRKWNFINADLPVRPE